jgi:hypothetical protein
MLQGISYMFNRVNEEHGDLLGHGLKFGYVMFDDCMNARAAATQALRFVPLVHCAGCVFTRLL